MKRVEYVHVSSVVREQECDAQAKVPRRQYYCEDTPGFPSCAGLMGLRRNPTTTRPLSETGARGVPLQTKEEFDMANQNPNQNQGQRGQQKEPEYQKNQDQRSQQQPHSQKQDKPSGEQQNRETSERIQPGSDDRGQPSREQTDPNKNYREQA
jgi:hypothetical protein